MTNHTAQTIANGWLALGIVGLGFVVAAAIGHYIFGLPIHEGHTDRLASPALIARTLCALGFGSGLFTLVGFWVFNRSRQSLTVTSPPTAAS